MDKTVKVKAIDEKEALALGRKQLADKLGQGITPEELRVKMISKKRNFMGFGKNKCIFEVSLKEDLRSYEEDFLEMAVENISIDGDFALKINDEGIFLKVSSAKGKGKDVHYQQIKTAIDKKKFIKIDWQVVQEVLQETTEEWVKIAPRLPELDKDGEAKVELSKDRLNAYLSYFPACGGKNLTVEDLKNVLAEAGVRYGIKEEKLEKLIENREPIEDLLIAEGKAPVLGKDAQFIYHFKDKTKSIGTMREDGSLDYYDLGLITNVKPGDLLVTKTKVESGTPGQTVTGENILPPKPKDKELPLGKNVKKKDDYTLIAAASGQLVLDGNKIHVLPIYEVKENVDLSTGNIDFIGNVYVRGDVLEGFQIKADGNVEIKGNVSGAKIEAKGDVIIHKGFIGKDKGLIKSGGNVKIKFIENGFISADKSVMISDAVMHSQLSAGERIEVTKNKGLLVGGTSKAGRKIEANIIGSSLATTTDLEVGIDPKLKIKLNQLERELKKDQVNLNKSIKALKILEKIKKRQGKLPQNKKLIYYQLQETNKKLEKAIADSQTEYESLQRKMGKIENGQIIINQRIYPGVKMTIGKSQFCVRDELSQTTFIEDKGEVRQVPL